MFWRKRLNKEENVFLQIRGIGEKYLGHLFITSSSYYSFKKTDFKLFLFEVALHFNLIKNIILKRKSWACASEKNHAAHFPLTF